MKRQHNRNFQRLRGRIKQQWARLSDDEIEKIEGDVEILASKLQERYGWDKEEAHRQAQDFSTRHGWQ